MRLTFRKRLLPAICLALAAPVAAAAAPPVAAPAAAPAGEPLPPGAPTDAYELAGWCYGALSEYLTIYPRVKADLRDIDRMFAKPGAKPEPEPYAEDIAALKDEQSLLATAIQAAEKASAQVISTRGAAAMAAGRAVWAPVEQKSPRELARAWMTWGLPDRCDSNARELTARSALLGAALKYNAESHDPH